jgi:predicted HTH domain antitoxin
METVEIPVRVDASFLNNWQDDDMPLAKRMRVWAAISLYLEQKISTGKAAQLSEMSYGEFQEYLGKHQIPISLLTLEDVLKDVERMK